MLNSFSKLEGGVWRCEFCGTQNQVDEDERPQEPALDYVLGAPDEAGQAAVVPEDEDTMVLFVIDTSGSMGHTEEIHVPGKPKEYISRLQYVQQAVKAQLESMYTKSPEKKVGLVSFNSKVRFYGDACQPLHTFQEDRLLSDYSALVEKGKVGFVAVKSNQPHSQRAYSGTPHCQVHGSPDAGGA